MLLSSLCDFLERFAPSQLAAEWDNVGLLAGDRSQLVERVLTCLTVTPAVAAEAIRERAGLIVTHHPLPFRPLKRMTTDEPTGRLLWSLMRASVAIYSPHTAYDSAAEGINQQLAAGLGLTEISPLVETAPGLGIGRQGQLPQPVALADVATRLKQFLGIGGLHLVGDPARPVERVGIACGSAGDLLDAAIQAGCQVFVTGEARLHTCYEAEARGVCLLLAGHYASERFAALRLAETIAAEFPTVTVWASRDERDPLVWV